MNSDYLYIPLDDVELKQLDQLFQSYSHPNVIINLSAIDGFVTALASGPDAVDFSEVMDVMLAGFPDELGPDERLQAQEWLVRHLLSTDGTLNQSPEAFDLSVSAEQNIDATLVGDWCAGYLLAVTLNAETWKELTDNSDLLLPIELFGTPGLAEDREQFESEGKIDRRALVISIAVMVYAYWGKLLEGSEVLTPHPNLIAANEPYLNEQRAVGRNDPCSCGSGKKFKKCCLGLASSQPNKSVTSKSAINKSAINKSAINKSAINKSAINKVRDAVNGAFENTEPENVFEANQIAAGVMEKLNQSPIDDFHGLSPSEMGQLLNEPFDAEALVAFSETLAEQPTGPFLLLWQLLADAIYDGGLKATAKGNLPRAFCQHAFERVLELGEEVEGGSLAFCRVNKEADFRLLELVRLMAQEMKLIQLRKGQFGLTKAGRALKDAEPGVVYREFFRAYARDFSWGFDDGYEEFATIQYGFMFTLYLLARYGSKYRPTDFYAEAYLRAFPMLLGEIEFEPEWRSDDEYIHDVYTLRSLQRFAARMGLVSMRRDTSDSLGREMEVKATPLLAQLLKFKKRGQH